MSLRNIVGDQSLKDVALQYIKAIETYDLTLLDQIIHPQYRLAPSEMAHTTRQIVNELGKDSKIIGIEGIKNRFSKFSKVWQDTEFTIHDIVAENNTVLLSFTMAYTFSGTLMGIQADNKRVRTRGYFTFKFHESKIISAYMLQDFFDVIRQLGLEFYENEEIVVQEYLDAVRKNIPFEL